MRPWRWLHRLLRRPSRAARRVVLYTRTGCHLCDDAKVILERYASHGHFTIDEIDIDTDASLREQYGTCVPVVLVDGKVRFRGRVNEVLLRRLLSRRD
jgi:glutaredoxin